MWKAGALDPIGLFKGINDPDPMASAKRLVLYLQNPQLYLQEYFPESAGAPDSANPPPQGQIPPQQATEPSTLSQEPASASLSNVPLQS